MRRPPHGGTKRPPNSRPGNGFGRLPYPGPTHTQRAMLTRLGRIAPGELERQVSLWSVDVDLTADA